MLETKTTTDGRQPQNSKSSISQQPLIGSSSNFKLKGIESQMLERRGPPMEEELKKLKVEYLSNH